MTGYTICRGSDHDTAFCEDLECPCGCEWQEMVELADFPGQRACPGCGRVYESYLCESCRQADVRGAVADYQEMRRHGN